MEWQFDWELQGRIPLQVELTMAIGAKGEEIRQIFWVPPKQNPEVLMRQMVQAGGDPPAGAGNPDGAGNPGGSITMPGGELNPNPTSGSLRPPGPRKP
jgi:hypothetical protein